MRVTMDFVKCSEESPNCDGYYAVATMSRDGFFMTDLRHVEYTKEYGWNTHIRYDGVPNNEHRLNFEERDTEWWAKTVVVEGGESDE